MTNDPDPAEAHDAFDPNATRAVTINFRITRATRADIDGWAEYEDRTRSDMARVLIDEALEARDTRRKQDPPPR